MQSVMRRLAAIHLACAAPLVALAIWFGVIDSTPFGEGRCASCGVEDYVLAAHVAAAAWLAALVRFISPGRLTTVALTAAALFVAASLLWHPLFAVPAFVAMVVSLLLFPAGAIWWVLSGVALWRKRSAEGIELRRRLAAAWLGLVVLLPAHFGWVWADRVEWIVF